MKEIEIGRIGLNRKRNILYLVVVMIVLFLMLLGSSCILSPPSFDEGKWRKAIEGQKVDGLYAPHYKDGRYSCDESEQVSFPGHLFIAGNNAK